MAFRKNQFAVAAVCFMVLFQLFVTSQAQVGLFAVVL